MRITDIIKDYFSPITYLFKTQKELDEEWIAHQPITPEYKEFLETYTEWKEDDAICIAIRYELPHLKCKLRTKGYDINVKVSGNVLGSELETVARVIRDLRPAGVGTLGNVVVGFAGRNGLHWTSSFDVGEFDE